MAKVYTCQNRYALQHFKGCHNRVRDGKCPFIFWKRNNEGYEAFCNEIGPFPNGMKKPSVGRIDHNKGYEPGNIRWEEHRHNSVKRRGTKHEGSKEAYVEFKQVLFRKGSPEYFDHQRKASMKRWADPHQREIMSQRMKSNDHATRKTSNA